ncbi:hypothetical protein GCM10009412_34600 [Aeromonas salmonicida subsp. achromogenes]
MLLRTEPVEGMQVFILCPFRHMSLYEKGNAIKENGIQIMTSLFSVGSSAVLGIYTLRPVALRPDLSIGLPFTLCPDDNTPL